METLVNVAVAETQGAVFESVTVLTIVMLAPVSIDVTTTVAVPDTVFVSYTVVIRVSVGPTGEQEAVQLLVTVWISVVPGPATVL
jgi:hypothetical protein